MRQKPMGITRKRRALLFLKREEISDVYQQQDFAKIFVGLKETWQNG